MERAAIWEGTADRAPRPAFSDDDIDYEDFFENGGIPLHVVGADGTILRANGAELELLGYAEEEYVGRPIADFHVDADAIFDILTRLKRGEKLKKHPARLRARDGSIKDVEITSSVQFRNGEFVHTRCFTVDVTELRRAHALEKDKDAEMRQILDALPAAVYMTDAQGKITYYNRTAVEFAGREPVLGVDEWCVTFRLFTSDGQPLAHDQCPMATALKENRPIRGVEAMAQRPDGTLVPFVPFPTPIRDATGRLIGAINMLVDISERKQSETHQRILLDELNHRVKNNVQMLQSLLMASMRETHSAEARTVLADAAQRVAAIAAAQQLLYNEASPRSFGMSEFLNAVCATVRHTFPKQANMKTDGAAGQLSNNVSVPLALILSELLTNAAKHAMGARDGGEVQVSLRRDGSETLLIVEDDGPGFEIGDARRRSSGLGLIRGLAQQLRGSFSVERGRSGGARCTLRFSDMLVD